MRTKNFMKVVATAAIVLLSMTSFAQNGRFSVGAELGLPMGTFGDAASIGIGGSLRYEMPMGDNLGLMLTAGYMSFSGKTVAGFDLPNETMIPIQVGAKYYFTEQQDGFYGAVELGVHSTSVTIPAYAGITVGGVTYGAYPESKVTSTDFSYAPGVGYALANVDIGLRYQIISSTGGSSSYLGVRLAYVFGAK
jgi:hypothetical protein